MLDALARSSYNLRIAAAAGVSTARARRLQRPAGTIHIYLCIVDHFEPQLGKPTCAIAAKRMQSWLQKYPQVAARHVDSEGNLPAHSFFYPWDEYNEDEMRSLVALTELGCGEVDLHLHHSNDTEESLRVILQAAIAKYSAAGVLPVWPDGRPAWGFIHGNWALDNSRHENGINYCGVNSELSLLDELGCYADFTFPAWKQSAQPRTVNSIYYAVDDPRRPRSHDFGYAASTRRPNPKGLMIVQGPLVPYLRRAGYRCRPAMDDADLAGYRRYSPDRLDRWVGAGIHVLGRPDRVFIKLHTHGADERNLTVLLDTDLDALFTDADRRYNDGKRYALHYVTARELFNIVKATEAEADDSGEGLRNWVLKPPAARLKNLMGSGAS